MVHLLTDSLHRLAYATDASAYREIPMAVAYPRDEEDIRWLMEEARRRHTHLIPRAGGTSIAGQVVGSGIVVDVSRYMNRILEIDADHRRVRVQPGVVLDELNVALRPYGLFFSPETSTSNRCCIGGMVGNNSCGTHSLIYGATRDHVLDLKYLLAPGVREEDLRAQLLAWKQDPAMRQRITNAFPDTTLRRRSCGYALDEAIEGEEINLTKLICGSEGTLCFVTEITLSLDPLPPAHKWVECLFLDRLDDAWEANLQALKRQPVAVELIDGKILELAKSNIQACRDMEVLHLDGTNLPAAILVSEFRGDALPSDSHSTALTLYDSDVDKVWALRKAGLGVLTSMPGDAKPVGVIEDTAVAPQRLGAYMHDFQAMMQQLGLDCVYYGHIATGELHLRPILNLKDAHDLQRFRQVAEQTARLVHKHHGSLSGEHGDGRLRGEFIPLMYGDEVYDLFRRIKHTWDPNGIFNIGKIVDTPPMDTFLRTRVGQPTSDLLRRVERCNGAGVCRKSIRMGGTMCPSYKVSGDELMSTRARANALREYLTSSATALPFEGKDGLGSMLYSCLACKGCRSECPSNVDMTALRSEALQQYYDRHGVPFHTWMVAHMALIERIGSWVPDVYNWFARTQWTSRLLKRMVRFAAERSIPTLSRHSMQWYIRRLPQGQPTHGRVYLFADEFTCYQEAELGLHFAELLIRLGYEVVVPRHVESGRAAISKGCLHQATRYARKNVQLLAPLISEDTPLVGIEPSCLLSFRDEYPHLLADSPLAAQSTSLANHCLLFDEFLVREMHRGHITPASFMASPATAIYLHGHCHQKALVGVEKTAECLRTLLHADVHVIPSGCCGMAGSFGYEADHYATSMAIGEQVLFPAIRQAQSSSSSAAQQFAPAKQQLYVAAPGTSCRQHILDGTGITAFHPIEILYRASTLNS